MRMKIFSLSTLVGVFFLGACAYQGGIDNPIDRKFSWFSYIDGGDIRRVCKDLGADRYRFVYNGVYQYQTRTYDVFGASKKLVMTVNGESNLRELTLNNPLVPWQPKKEELLLSDRELVAIKQSLASSAALQTAPKGLRLSSDEFYWTVAACVEGSFYFNAFRWATEGFEGLEFDDLLLGLDVTDIPIELPRDLPPSEKFDLKEHFKPFVLEVGVQGLVGFEGK